MLSVLGASILPIWLHELGEIVRKADFIMAHLCSQSHQSSMVKRIQVTVAWYANRSLLCDHNDMQSLTGADHLEASNDPSNQLCQCLDDMLDQLHFKLHKTRLGHSLLDRS